MTREEWDEKWWALYGYFLKVAGLKQPDAFKYAHDRMVTLHGPRPEEKAGLPLRLKIPALVFGGEMANFLKLISRFGPLLAAFAVGLVGVIPGADSVLQGVVSLLGLFGVQPDAETAAQFGNIVAAVLLLYGSVVKFYHLIRDKFFPPAA